MTDERGKDGVPGESPRPGRDPLREARPVRLPRPSLPLRVHAFDPYSQTSGPGTRAVVWLQGCTLGCPGCWTPETHPPGGHEVTVDELFAHIAGLGGRIEGVTVSGGEPLQQFRPLLRLLTRIREETSLSVLVFTGFGWEEIVRMPGAAALRDRVDVLLAGRYVRDLRLGRGLRGSSNKTVHLFTDRYTAADLDAVPDAEVVIRADGRLAITGIDPPPRDE
ncbi:radical SAM protein [Actinomadura sp. KC06]|uniref:4Fe-4S single cluster domain-containing protein n=1 Tax=Actinomadura sp. KC06 TaxID=2530369 RepID=UPI00104954D8|nr:4Fe-4S single cluster domain-containing protein [Actinomadura sp. KC06]TDD29280.1 radical SAM protein [Actinomadura sp. KC06]